MQRILQNQGCTRGSGFDPVELWVMGPPCGLKVGGAVTSLHGHDSKARQRVAYQLCGQQPLVPRVRDEENHFPAR